MWPMDWIGPNAAYILKEVIIFVAILVAFVWILDQIFDGINRRRKRRWWQ